MQAMFAGTGPALGSGSHRRHCDSGTDTARQQDGDSVDDETILGAVVVLVSTSGGVVGHDGDCGKVASTTTLMVPQGCCGLRCS